MNEKSIKYTKDDSQKRQEPSDLQKKIYNQKLKQETLDRAGFADKNDINFLENNRAFLYSVDVANNVDAVLELIAKLNLMKARNEIFNNLNTNKTTHNTSRTKQRDKQNKTQRRD